MNPVTLFLTIGLSVGSHLAESPPGVASSGAETRPSSAHVVYGKLIAADDWKPAQAAANQLAKLGREALPLVLQGTRHPRDMVREYSYQVLQRRFPTDPKAIDAIIRGLKDTRSGISYPCAFHLGEHRLKQAAEALRQCVRDEDAQGRTRYAAAKSLAEIGDDDFFVMLYVGIGSDDHYTRYLSNIGIKALTGRDLTDFGYRGPWEGAAVLGSAVVRVKGQPMEKAQRKLERWQAVVAFLEWLRSDCPALFKKLEQMW